jgi:hypothetical protein
VQGRLVRELDKLVNQTTMTKLMKEVKKKRRRRRMRRRMMMSKHHRKHREREFD